MKKIIGLMLVSLFILSAAAIAYDLRDYAKNYTKTEHSISAIRDYTRKLSWKEINDLANQSSASIKAVSKENTINRQVIQTP